MLLFEHGRCRSPRYRGLAVTCGRLFPSLKDSGRCIILMHLIAVSVRAHWEQTLETMEGLSICRLDFNLCSPHTTLHLWAACSRQPLPQGMLSVLRHPWQGVLLRALELPWPTMNVLLSSLYCPGCVPLPWLSLGFLLCKIVM